LLLGGLLCVGLASTVYEVCLLRVFPVLHDSSGVTRYTWLAPDRQLGKRTYAMRRLYDSLRSTLPTGAVVQQNPDTDPQDLPAGLYADRQFAADTAGCGDIFGGDPALCPAVFNPLNDLFNHAAAWPGEDIDAVCGKLAIDVLVVKDSDPAWADSQSWVWKRNPLVSNGMARALACGPRTAHN
jgi:hypothetical protein